MCMTPSAQLLQHEWAKHGTCMSPHPAAYFRAAEILFREVRFPDMTALVAKRQTAGSVRRAFASVKEGIAPEMIAVVTHRPRRLDAGRLCLGWWLGAPGRKPVSEAWADSAAGESEARRCRR